MNENLFAAAAPASASSRDPLAPKLPHFTAKAKHVIFLHMAGAPSQLDLFDYKPKLIDFDGKPVPEEFIKGERFAFIKGTPKCLATPHTFNHRGKCGAHISDLLPHLATVVDDLCIIRSMHTDHFNHAPAQLFVQTGSQIQGRPGMGAGASYGLGTQ